MFSFNNNNNNRNNKRKGSGNDLADKELEMIENGALINGPKNDKLTYETDFKIQFKNVSYGIRGNPNTKKSQDNRILKDVCGQFRCGKLTAILGPSGAGKTSMLNVLSGFKTKNVTGEILINNELRHLMTFRQMCSYISQDFVLLQLLNVRETLKVSADLKLPQKTTKKEKNRIMDDILRVLNMEDCQQTLVKHLSGGERKRLSIAIELLTNPPFMFFDEPTSGLDSVSSQQVMNYLRKLARDGRVVVCVVHQPSSQLMGLFDDILVMSHGEVLYSGEQSGMIKHFESAGFKCPNYFNPADFVLEVASKQHNAQVQSLLDKCKKDCRVEKKDSNILVEVRKPSQELTETFQNSVFMRPKAQVSSWRQFSVLTLRSLRCMSRNMIAIQVRVVTFIAVALLMSLMYWNIGNDGAKVLTNISCIFFIILFCYLGNGMPSILLCPDEVAVFVREYLNGWFSLFTYYCAKVVADLPLQLFCPTVLISCVYYTTAQPLEWNRFFMCWTVCLLANIIGHLMGLIIGTLCSIQLAMFILPAISIPLTLFAGFFIRVHELSSFLRPLADITFFRYTLESTVQALYSYNRTDLECSTEFCYFRNPTKFLREMGMEGENFERNVIVLSIWVFGLLILLLLSLVWRVRRTQ